MENGRGEYAMTLQIEYAYSVRNDFREFSRKAKFSGILRISQDFLRNLGTFWCDRNFPEILGKFRDSSLNPVQGCDRLL